MSHKNDEVIANHVCTADDCCTYEERQEAHKARERLRKAAEDAEIDTIADLSFEYADKSLEELRIMEEAIQHAKQLKADMKRDNVPQEDIDELRTLWKLAAKKKRVVTTVEVVIETDCCDSDPCSVYSRIVKPDWLADWDAEVYADFWGWSDDIRNTIIQNEMEIRKYVEMADKFHRNFREKHDVNPGEFL